MLSRTSATLILGIGIGTLIALPIAAPAIWDAKLPDGAATLWGAALGAVIAVAGAYWVASIPLRIQRRNAAALVFRFHQPLAFFLEEVTYLYGHRSSASRPASDVEPDLIEPDGWRGIADSAKSFLDAYQHLQRKHARIDSAVTWLVADDLAALMGLEIELESVAQALEELYQEASQPGRRLYADHPSWGRRFSLSVFNAHVIEYMRVLQAAAE
ncbi:hypothetical protein FHW83_001427 [Duganella sp. SG902]|uniref:hypothetical protein n=1 Tax=Duganella sp. SG902 TaxID=2587016 RepID=UPI00159E5A65|nr:hypothetical protein [Duganella sp. SG902]NVM75640.1 hypothetical protein [Duganella sp. SG902]